MLRGCGLAAALSEVIDLPTVDEGAAQRFFEQNPSALLHGYKGALLGRRLVSQLRLGTDYRSDFAYVSQISGMVILNLIEIESPRMDIFTQQHQFTSSFTKAYQQLEDWASYVGGEGGEQIWSFLTRCYGGEIALPLYSRTLETSLTLIAGRQRDLSSSPDRQRRLNARRQNGSVDIRTYDGIIRDLAAMSFLPQYSCHKYANGKCAPKD